LEETRGKRCGDKEPGKRHKKGKLPERVTPPEAYVGGPAVLGSTAGRGRNCGRVPKRCRKNHIRPCKETKPAKKKKRAVWGNKRERGGNEKIISS